MIDSIFIACGRGLPPTEVKEVELVAGKGIVGDRNFGKDTWPGQNITFIEAEEIESFNATYDRSVARSDPRRNVVTRSVRLNELVGKRFSIGGVEFYGVELCEPCKSLGTRLGSDAMSSAQVVRAWVHKGGLRADVLSNGTIRVGMRFHVESSA